MVSHTTSPQEMYLHPMTELSGQLAQLEVLLAPSSFWSGQHSPWPGCEVPPVQGQACAGQGLGQACPADDHQLPRGGGPAHSPGGGEE